MQNLPHGKINLLIVIPVAVVMLAGALLHLQSWRTKPSIKIGVLHSLTGTMAISEIPLVDAVRLAVEEANQSGGVNGRQIEMIVADCRSDAAYCAQQADKLIAQDGVQALSVAGHPIAARRSKQSSRDTIICCSIRCNTRVWSNHPTSSTPARHPTSKSSRWCYGRCSIRASVFI